MGKHRFGSSVLVAVLALLAFAATAHATFPGANGKIVFQGRNGDGDYELFTINPDGTGRTQITHNDVDENGAPLNDTSASWSPRGDKLLFIRRFFIPGLTALDSVYTADPDGSGEQELFTSIVPNVGWSPDGNRIAYTACTEFGHGSCFGYDAFAGPIDGNGVRLARHPDEWELDVDWSPDGSRIAISGFEDTWTVSPDGTGDVTPLVTGPGNNTGPSWSPDGTRLTFTSNRDGNSEIYVANADGTAQTRLTDNPLNDSGAVWSPDGTKIMFSRWRCDSSACFSNVLTMDADGTNETPLTHNDPDTNVFEASSDWQPIPGPRPSDYKNRSQFCKAEREFWGDEGFRARYGGGANAHGKCVSGGG